MILFSMIRLPPAHMIYPEKKMYQMRKTAGNLVYLFADVVVSSRDDKLFSEAGPAADPLELLKASADKQSLIYKQFTSAFSAALG